MIYTWEIIINIIEVLIFFMFANGEFKIKKIPHCYIKQLLFLITLSLFTFFLNFYNIPATLSNILVLFIHYIYTCIFFYKAVVNIFGVVIFSAITILADALTTIIPTKIFNIDITSILSGGYLRIPFTLIYVLILTILTYIVLCFSTKMFNLTLFEKIVFILLSIICLVIEEFIVVSQTEAYFFYSTRYNNLLYIIFFFVMCIFISLSIYIYTLGRMREKNLQLLELQTVSEIERVQYNEIVSSVSQLRFLRHDLKNHISTLQYMIENEKYQEANQYINDLSKTVNKTYHLVACGNPTIDSVLTNKIMQCKASNIIVKYTVILPDKIPLSDIEICSLLGNLIDNAIEASIKIHDTNLRTIDLHIRPFNDMLCIKISNSSNGQYINTKKGFNTSKKSSLFEEHGLGLSRVKDIIDSHSGMIQILPENSKFTVNILIPLDT